MATAELVKQDAGVEAHAQAAQEVASKIKDALADGQKALWRLGEALYAFDEMRGWQQLGYYNLSAWLADTDGAITRGTYYRLVGTWRKVVVDLEVDAERVCQLDQSKVAIVADKIGEDEVNVDDALADVEALPAQDLREKYGRPAVVRRPKVQASESNEQPTATTSPAEQLTQPDKTPPADNGRKPEPDSPAPATSSETVSVFTVAEKSLIHEALNCLEHKAGWSDADQACAESICQKIRSARTSQVVEGGES